MTHTARQKPEIANRPALRVIEGNPAADTVSAADDSNDFEAGRYRPCAFYFRCDIREASLFSRAQKIARCVVEEHRQLEQWIRKQEHGKGAPPTFRFIEDDLARAFDDLAASQKLALEAVSALERLHAWVVERGGFPQRWKGSPREGLAKGW